jgi:hypothetical protein
MLKKVRYRRETGLACPFWSWPIAEVLRDACDALREAMAAHRQYECLRSRGVRHDTALRQALSIGHSACECNAKDRGSRESASKPFPDGTFPSIGVLSYLK